MLILPHFVVGNYAVHPIQRTDQAFVFSGLSDPEVVRYYGVSYTSLEDTAAQMDFYDRLLIEETGAGWKIVDRETQQPLGVLTAYLYQLAHQRIEIGFWLIPAAQGKGIIHEVLPSFIAQLRRLFNLHRIEAMVETGNEASCRVLEKAGFEREGILRDYEIKNGKRISLIVYSLLLDHPIF
jgi:ribosomal-protein-alanine N-acetyltransferase